MPKLQRRQSSVNQNTLNVSSDDDNNSKHKSDWWKNLSSTRNSVSNVLNDDSTIAEDQNSQWWRHLSENENVPSPNKVNITGEIADKSTEDRREKNLSQSESDENENIFPKKRLFVSKDQHSRKTRYSNAFNLNAINSNEEEQNSAQKKDNNFEIDEFKNVFQDDKNIESRGSTAPKGKKKRRTKSIFSKKMGKRKFSDAFTVTDNEPTTTEHNKKDKILEKEDSAAENVSISKQRLFQLNLIEKRYSEAFLNAFNEPIENIPEKQIDIKKNDEQEHANSTGSHNQTEETFKIVKKVNLFKPNLKKKKYSEAFVASKSKDLQNSSAMDDSESSEEDIQIEEINTQKTHAESINITNEKNNLSKRDSKSKKKLSQDDNKEKENNEYEVEETKLDPSQYVKKSQKLSIEGYSSDEENIKEIKTHKEAAEKSINVTKEMKNTLFKKETKVRKYSEVFLGPSGSKIIQDDICSQSEKENDDHESNQVSSQHGKESFFKLQNKSRKYSQACDLDDDNKENNHNEIIITQQNAEKLKNKHIKPSQAYMELISIQKEIEEERANSAKQINIENKYLEVHADKLVNEIVEKEIDTDDTKFTSISSIDVSADIKHPLFRPKARKSLYSSKSATKNELSNINSQQEPQKNLEKIQTGRISSKRYSLRSTSPAESGISKFFEESLISSTKLFINANGEGSDGSEKKKIRKSHKSSSVVNENPDELENDVLKSSENIDVEFDAEKNINNKPKRGRSKSTILTIVPENPDNASNNDIIHDYSELEKVQNKNISNRNRKSKSIIIVPENQDIPLDINENTDIEPGEPMKNKHSTSKTERKSKSEVSISVDPKNNESENEENQDSETDALVKNNILNSGRKSKSVSRIHEESKSSESKKIFKKKKRGRPPKSTSIDSGNIQLEKEIITNDKRNTAIQEYPQHSEPEETNKITISSSGRKSKIVSSILEDFKSSASETEIPKSNKTTESNKIIKKKKMGRPPKSTLINSEYIVNTPEKGSSVLTSMKKSLIRTVKNEIEENKKSFINKTREYSKKKVKIIDSSTLEENTVILDSDLEDSLNIHEKSHEISIEKPALKQIAKISTSNQYQSSKFSKENNYEFEDSLSNIITINSSTSKARPSQFSNVNKNVENWLSKSFVESAQTIAENKNTGEFLSTLNLEPMSRRNKKLFRWRQNSKAEQISTEDELKRKELLSIAVNDIQEKQNKSPPKIPVRKITDYFNTLNQNEKLKPIPKGTNNAKKNHRPVCTARLINGKPYYSKKLFRGKCWCTPRFYKYLQNKMEDEYGEDTINESEKIMKYIVNSVQAVIKSKKYLKNEVDNLMKELARHKIILTTYDFFCLCGDFLPAEYQDLVVPMTKTNKSELSVPCDEKDVFKSIQY